MKFCWLFSLLVIVLCSCSDSTENLVGKWKYSRLEKDKIVFLSDDAAEQTRIIDKHIAENNEFIRDIPKFRWNAEKEMAARLEVFFDIKADSTVTVSDFTQGSDIQTWKYLIDEEAKTISFITHDRTIVYNFKLENDKLVLDDKVSKMRMDLKKQAE